MSADYRVDLPGLQRLVDGAATFETTIEDLVTDIDKRIDALHVNWSGEAAAAHRAAYEARIKAVADMRLALAELRAKLKSAHEAYSTVGPVNRGMWP